MNTNKESYSVVLASKTLHEMRNNLNTILGYSQICQDEGLLFNEQQRMQLAIEKAALNIKSLLSVKTQETNILEIENQLTQENFICDTTVKFTNQKILIVDDKPESISLFKEILRPYPYEIMIATSGKEALKTIESFRPDLILLDVVMPNMSGYEVLQELKDNKITSEIPVIFLTANNSMQDIVKGFEAGVVDYIAKPFYPRELIVRIDTHLKKAKLFENLKRLLEHSFHELYTPLSVINSAMQMQELEYVKTDYTQMALAASKTLQNIYDDLYYSIQYADAIKYKTIFDFKELIHQRINYFSLVAQSRFLTFKIKLPLHIIVELNEEEMERVLDNLISNALKYTKEFHEITIKVESKNNLWLFSICNPIFKKVSVEKIFQKYYRHEEERFGLGLGLDLVQSICKNNQIPIHATVTDKLFCIKMELAQKS